MIQQAHGTKAQQYGFVALAAEMVEERYQCNNRNNKAEIIGVVHLSGRGRVTRWAEDPGRVLAPLAKKYPDPGRDRLSTF